MFQFVVSSLRVANVFFVWAAYVLRSPFPVVSRVGLNVIRVKFVDVRPSGPMFLPALYGATPVHTSQITHVCLWRFVIPCRFART